MYAMTLGAALLVTVTGLSAVTVARINLRNTTRSNDWAEAEFLALSGVEHALELINQDSNWRNTYQSGQATSKVTFGRGSFSWMLVDEADSDLRDAKGEPAQLYSLGIVGDATRVYSVLLRPYGEPLDALRCALHA
jgi:hypothetical protein